MTVREHLSAYPVAFQTSPRRSSSRIAEVRSNCDVGSHDAYPKIRNRAAFWPGIADRAPKPPIPALATHHEPSAAH
jgi:hypothetical protein